MAVSVGRLFQWTIVRGRKMWGSQSYSTGRYWSRWLCIEGLCGWLGLLGLYFVSTVMRLWWNLKRLFSLYFFCVLGGMAVEGWDHQVHTWCLLFTVPSGQPVSVLWVQSLQGSDSSGVVKVPIHSNRIPCVLWLCPSQVTKHKKGSHRCPS